MNNKISKKERRIFWVGILAGMVGGITGNLLVGYIFEWYNKPSYINLIGVIVFTLIFLGLLIWINKQIIKNK